MSITAPPRVESPRAKSTSTGKTVSGADDMIVARIAEASAALWWAEVVRTTLRMIISSIAVLLAWVVIDQWVYSPGMGLRTVALAALAAWLGWYVYRNLYPLIGSSIRPEYAARSLERDLPELRQALTSYVTLRDEPMTAGDNEAKLRNRVVRSIGAATAGRLKNYDALPVEATGTMRWWVVTAVMLAILVAYAVVSPKNSLTSAARLVAPMASIDPPRRVSIRDVQPGDIDVIAGRQIEVSCLIDGLRSDDEVMCRWESASGRQAVVLTKQVDSRRHSGELSLHHLATGDVTYRIHAGDAQSEPYRLRVQDVPVVALQSIEYQSPAYTGQATYTSSRGAITAIDGTQVTIRANVNRPVARAAIEFNPRALGNVVRATASAREMQVDDTGTSISVSFSLRGTRGRSAAVQWDSYRIQVWDAAGQSNPDPIIYPIRVVADLPPEVAIMMPVKSPKNVPINAQQIVEVHASDPDFGLQQIRLQVRAGIDVIDEPILWSDEHGAKGNQVTEYRFRPTEHGLRVGDLVRIVAVATDNRRIENDPGIEPNVVRTDPIELKIVAGESLPTPGDPEGEGLSAPDQRAATDQPQQQDGQSKESGDQGQPQSGGGSSNDQGPQQPGDGQTGDGQPGDGQPGGDSQSEGEQSADSQSRGNGSSSEDSSNDNNGSKGNDGSDGAITPSNNDDPNNSDNEGDAASKTPTGSDKANSDPGDGNPSGSDPGQQAGDRSGNPSGDQDPAAEPRGNAGSTEGNPQPGTTGGESTDSSSQKNDGSDGPSSNQPNNASDGGNRGESDPNPQAGDKGSPKHDGEAFERIRDHLEQNRKQESPGGHSESEQTSPEQSADSEGRTSSGNEGASSSRPDGDAAAEPESGSVENRERQDHDGSKTPSAPGDKDGEGTAGDTANQSPNSSGTQGERQSDQSSDSSGSSKQNASPQTEKAGSSDPKSSDIDDGNRPTEQAGDEASAQPNGKPGDESGTPNQPDDGMKSKPPAGSGEQPSSGEQSSSGNPSDAGSKSDAKSDPGANSDSQTSQSQPGTGEGKDGSGEGGDAPQPPDPVNLDYAKQATDMVLDYLDQTRDAPDRELLEKLDWSEEDLKRFHDRWQSVREMQQAAPTDPQANRELEETLNSLGIRPPSTDAPSTARDSADTLRRIRDSGNRKPPPAAHRDAFDAFRRAMGQR